LQQAIHTVSRSLLRTRQISLIVECSQVGTNELVIT
jgi:hypothetical protein